MTLVSDAPRSRRAHYVGIDNAAAGRTAASLLGRFVAGRTGKVGLIAGSIALRDHIERQIGFEQVIARDFRRSLAAADPRGARRRRARRGAGDGVCSRENPDLVGIYNVGAGNGGIVAALEATRRPRRDLHRPRTDAVLAQAPDPRHHRRDHQPGSRARGAKRRYGASISSTIGRYGL